MDCAQNKAYAAIEAARAALQKGDAGQDAAHALVDASRDILALTLDKEVRRRPPAPRRRRPLTAP